MNQRTILLIIALIIVLGIIGFLIYHFLFKVDENLSQQQTNTTTEEKRGEDEGGKKIK